MINFNQQGIFTFLFSVLFLSAGAQVNTPRGLKAETPLFSHQYHYRGGEYYHFIDTSFNSLRDYRNWNNAGKDLFEYSVLSSMGTALNHLTLSAPRSIWDYYNFKAYDPYFTKQKEMKYFDVKSALVQANYWMGYDAGQRFEIYHTQNIKENWNFLIQYKRLNDLGFYFNNQSKQANFIANTHYSSKDDRYKLYLNFSNDKLEVTENGGIAVDSVFEENLESRRVQLDVGLDADSRSMQKRQFFINQEYLFINGNKDSISEVQKYLFGIGHDFAYQRKSDLYHGVANSGFYSNYFNGVDTYSDSSYYDSYVNSVYFITKAVHRPSMKWTIGAKNLVFNYGTDLYSTTGNSLGLVTDFTDSFNSLRIKANLDYMVLGNMAKSYDINIRATTKGLRLGNVEVSMHASSRFPDLFKHVNIGDNFIWRENLHLENRRGLNVSYRWNEFGGISLSTTRIENFTYFDSVVQPVQYQKNLLFTKIQLDQDFRFGKILHWDNKIYYQLLDKDGKEILPTPDWLLRSAVYFEFSMVKKALNCIIGAEVKYFSSYQSQNYNPAIGDFTISNSGEIGNYPLFNVFANFKIRQARVFVKLEHANQGLLSYSYYAAPSYPFPDRILRVGVSWRFFN